MRKLYSNFKVDVQKILNSGNIKDYEKGYLQPPLNLEKMVGITGIAHDFNLGGIPIRDIQLLAEVDYHLGGFNMFKLLQDLQKLNKPLRVLRFNDEITLYNYLLGIASLINLDDIIFYCGEYKTKYDSMWMNTYPTSWHSRMVKILELIRPDKNIGKEIQWIISPNTADYIYHAAGEKLMASTRCLSED